MATRFVTQLTGAAKEGVADPGLGDASILKRRGLVFFAVGEILRRTIMQKMGVELVAGIDERELWAELAEGGGGLAALDCNAGTVVGRECEGA
jgi:hypothetical protein